MTRSSRTAEQLQQLLLERMEAIPDLRGQLTDVHRGGVIWMDPSEGGPNWTVRVVSDRGTHRADIARIIRTLQGQYDLEE